jgi:hypothetical protein
MHYLTNTTNDDDDDSRLDKMFPGHTKIVENGTKGYGIF